MATPNSSVLKAAAALSIRDRLERAQKELEIQQPLTPTQKEVIDALKTLHVEHMAFEREYREEWTALKKKYFLKLKPLYDQRRQKLTDQATGVSTLPNFWLTALKSHSTIAETIEEYDEPILRYLENIDYEWIDDNVQTSFRIKMTFAENQYFANRELVKEFELEEDPETYESVLSRSSGTVIDWKAGKNVTKKICNRKQRNKRTGETRLVKNEIDQESFFHFFDSHEIPDDEKLEQMKEHEVQELENTLEVEYELGSVMRDKIITHALGWYLGIENDEDEEDEDDEEDDEEDVTGEDNSEEEEEEDSDDEEIENNEDGGAGRGDEDNSDDDDTNRKTDLQTRSHHHHHHH